jgi:hypothetical protein
MMTQQFFGIIASFLDFLTFNQKYADRQFVAFFSGGDKIASFF